MLPKGPHVKEVFTNPKTGLLCASLSRPILYMECSTIDSAISNEVNTLTTSAGHRFVDAPVSGGPNGANAGSLTFMIGGSADLFAEARATASSTAATPVPAWLRSKSTTTLARSQ
jgi:3-hydroxyisobutyrate dehydrogenase